jgi:hypothetical protein
MGASIIKAKGTNLLLSSMTPVSTWDAYIIGKTYTVALNAPITAAPPAEGAGIEKKCKKAFRPIWSRIHRK